MQHYFYYIHSKHITSCFIFVDDVLSCLQRLPRFYVSTSKSIIKALINMHSFEIQLSPIG
ncbi:TPA: hypothetical protein J4O52_001728 [Escherichia coli]|nr:hypothetical protein [Escherichia coli]HBA5770016.1 hypothetical protein [Escherichia coli]HBA5817119.1 hypothetical protein [Escherichia coli]HBA5824663.1 hypothetical protein [Escherichia coli]HBA5829895.1 hypothetical protein [Escherichia coli]